MTTVNRHARRERRGSPSRHSSCVALHVLVSSLLAMSACARPPRTADQVLDRSIAAHGGPALTDWQTLTIRGRIQMQDGITYNAGYLLLARAPDKLRVEHDMTKDRGRRFDEYFMNGAAVWSRANLVVGAASQKQLQRWFLQALGPAQARRGAVGGLTLKPDALAEWQEPAEDGAQSTDRRPSYVIAYTRSGDVCELYIDKETFYLLEETWPGGRRLYRGFKPFGVVTFPTRILEITRGREGDVVTPITLESVVRNAPVEDWLFSEDMPRDKH
jgi:hypothetical protein